MRNNNTQELPAKRNIGVLPDKFVQLQIACLFLLSLASRIATGGPLEDLPLELRPFRVHLLVAFDIPQQSPQARLELLDEIRKTANRCIGSQWNLTVGATDHPQPVSADGLARLTAADVSRQAEKEIDDSDVWLAVTVRSNGPGWRIDVRSWQPSVGIAPDVAGADIYDRLDLPTELLRICHSVLRPIGVVDDVDGKNVRVILQAGALSVPDEAFSLIGSTSVFTPVMASRKRDGKIDRLQMIPWTYLTVNESHGASLSCELHSGLRSPIGGKKRGRVETLAIAVKAVHLTTRLELATQSKLSLPLVAHRIELRDSSEIPKPDEVNPLDDHLLKVMLTDRRGQVTIPADPKGSVSWLFAYSGKHLLARVPIVAGSATSMRLEVPDDSARLEAESDLYMLQGQLIEAVAARNTATARIRAAIKKNEVDRAKAAAAELRHLPDAQAYLSRVVAIRIPSVKAAKARRDRAGEARINRMCDEMGELIRQYLNEDKRQSVLEELKELSTEDAAVDKQLQEADKP